MDEDKTEEQEEKKENAEDINLVRTVAGILRNKAGSFHGKRNFEIPLPNPNVGLPNSLAFFSDFQTIRFHSVIHISSSLHILLPTVLLSPTTLMLFYSPVVLMTFFTFKGKISWYCDTSSKF